MSGANEELRKLPKMDRLLERPDLSRAAADHGRERAIAAAREELAAARARIQAGGSCPSEDEIVDASLARLRAQEVPTLRPVLNATGVIVHTNLGRAPLAEDAIQAMAEVARGYSSLEFDLEEGGRGSRNVHVRRLLAELSGAEAALVVNNNASAVMLVLAALCRGREVVVSRGQLVEIGGGFRIPEVMAESGARLVEVGTTNRTYGRDYLAALSERTAALMLVHRSNFQIVGFTSDPEVGELAAIAHEHGLPLLDDLGSGTFLDTAAFGLAHEPTVQERVAAGADLVTFSGDKLLGGPQAGFIVGKRELIARLERFPMLRALRVDKVTLAGIEATLRHFVRGDATINVPVWRSIAMTEPETESRAASWRAALGELDPRLSVVRARSVVGGGSLPGLTLPTHALAIRLGDPDAAAKRLRLGAPPVVCRIEEGLLLFDPRTVLPGEELALLDRLRGELAHRAGGACAGGPLSSNP